jgi:hypothetical protein
MTLIIDDQTTCPVCGAYFQTNGYCSNGHPGPEQPDNQPITPSQTDGSRIVSSETEKTMTTCFHCGDNTLPTIAALCGNDVHPNCLTAHAEKCLACGLIQSSAPYDVAYESIAARMQKADINLDTSIYRVTWDDVAVVLAERLSAFGATADVLSDMELEKLLDDAQSAIEGEGMPWHDVLDIGMDDNWPARLDMPSPVVHPDNDILLTPLFWDCECADGNFIHPYYQERCSKCGAFHCDQPDSLVSEVFQHVDDLPGALLRELKPYAQHEIADAERDGLLEEQAENAARISEDGFLEMAYEDRVSGFGDDF